MVWHDVKTDPERWKAFDDKTAAALNDFGERRQLWPAKAFRGAKSGYIAGPLDGIWARAPYLHNGSVPTLYDLLHDKRPEQFCRGNPDYDPIKVGFKSETDAQGRCESGRFRYDTRLHGNSNAGHPFFPSSERDVGDLLAYLRSL
jgi:hypothetical protein